MAICYMEGVSDEPAVKFQFYKFFFLTSFSSLFWSYGLQILLSLIWLYSTCPARNSGQTKFTSL